MVGEKTVCAQNNVRLDLLKSSYDFTWESCKQEKTCLFFFLLKFKFQGMEAK